jgi:PKD repeat protein
MKKKRKNFYFLIVPVILLVIGVIYIKPFDLINAHFNEFKRSNYEAFLRNHSFNQKSFEGDYESFKKSTSKKDRPDLAWEQNYLATMNPYTKRVEYEKLPAIIDDINKSKFKKSFSPRYTWNERGPYDVGGRIRAVAFDPNTTNKVWVGSVSGGLWFNNDIADVNSEWQHVDDFWDNISIGSIAFDPNNSQIIYVGTGEGYFTGSSKGAGVWKSTDGGITWGQISSTSDYAYVQDIVVRNESGNSVIYAAVGRYTYEGQTFGSTEGLFRSTNSGSSWSQVLPTISGKAHAPSDLKLDANNNLWVGTMRNTDGNGAGKILKSTDGINWTTSYSYPSSTYRVELACAPSNANYVYALIEEGLELGQVVKTTNGGGAWSSMPEPEDADSGIPSYDFTRSQAWYDLAIIVDPNNENVVYAGGINVFKSTNGANSWNQISHWYGGYGYQYVHADIHNFTFKPGSSSELLVVNDGGIAYSSDATNSIPTLNHINKRLNITQFYACAIHPDANTDYYLAGTQDNGTQAFTETSLGSTIEVTGGDGAFCFIDKDNPDIQITSYVYNSYFLSVDGGNNFDVLGYDFTGSFINPCDYDSEQNILYANYDEYTLKTYHNVHLGTGSAYEDYININLGALASALKVSPYTTSSTTLLVGTQAGRLFKITNANSSPSEIEITGASFPIGNISSIDFGSNENEIAITFSNYGVTSVWYTNDGGSSWISKEGNLPDMPVRWLLFNPENNNEVMLATEINVWSTTNFSTSSPTWEVSNSGLANVRVDMLKTRTSDKQVIAATYGRGLFSSNFLESLNVNFTADNTSVSINSIVSFTDLSSSATSWTWSISPSVGAEFTNGTTLNNQNPQVLFSQEGTYSVTLQISNGNQGGSTTKTNYITVTEEDLSINQIDFERIEIYPNPSNGIFNVITPKHLIGSKFELFDSNGKVILNSRIKKDVELVSIKNPKLGVYYLRFSNSSGSSVKSIFISN